jgi:uncharacterized protein YbjT (DUF2867 family)
MRNILVLGGTGFVGSHVCEALQRAHCRMTVPTRHIKRAAHIAHLPLVTVVDTDVNDPDALTRLVAGHDAVVNLVAILHGSEQAFQAVHVDLPERLAQACEAAGVRRLVHVSALGASADGPSLYQRSKAAGESALRAHTLDLTVLRPSVIFGAGDRFLNMFARLQTLLPVMPLAGAGTRFQPVWVQDVAAAVVHALVNPSTIGQTVEAVGPDVFTLAELVRLSGQAVGHARPVVGLPNSLAMLQATLMSLMPGEPLMSADNVRSLSVDNVASPAEAGVPTLADWGMQPSSVAAILPTYLQANGQAGSPRQRLVNLRGGLR